MKTLLMLLVALGAWWLLRGLFRDRISGDSPQQDEGRVASGDPSPHETMVACAYCQLHLPRGEAVWLGEKSFCGQAHLQAHKVDGAGR